MSIQTHYSESSSGITLSAGNGTQPSSTQGTWMQKEEASLPLI